MLRKIILKANVSQFFYFALFVAFLLYGCSSSLPQTLTKTAGKADTMTKNLNITLKFLEVHPTEEGWGYKVELSIVNIFDHPVQLDGPSVAENGKISNNLFRVTVDGEQVQFHGMMKERSAPDQFIELKQGATYTVVVDLSEDYRIPFGDHQVTVKFEHTNHFSPDQLFMISAPIMMKFKKE